MTSGPSTTPTNGPSTEKGSRVIASTAAMAAASGCRSGENRTYDARPICSTPSQDWVATRTASRRRKYRCRQSWRRLRTNSISPAGTSRGSRPSGPSSTPWTARPVSPCRRSGCSARPGFSPSPAIGACSSSMSLPFSRSEKAVRRISSSVRLLSTVRCLATLPMNRVKVAGSAITSALSPLRTISLITLRWFSARSRSPRGSALRSRTNHRARSPSISILPLG